MHVSPLSICIRGDFDIVASNAVVLSNLAVEMYDLGFRVECWQRKRIGFTPDKRMADWYKRGKLDTLIAKGDKMDAVNASIVHEDPIYKNKTSPNHVNIALVPWCLEKIPEAAAEAYAKMGKRVFGISKFSCDTLKKSGIPCDYVRHGVDPNLFNYTELPDGPVTFAFVGTPTTLSGIELVAEAFKSEFQDNDNARLKVYLYSHLGWEPKINLESCGNADIIYGSIPYHEMPNIYKETHIIVQPFRAHAWLLPGLEAAACGRPTILSNYGGPLDYMDESDLRIECNMSNAKERNEELEKTLGLGALPSACFAPGVEWAEPSIESLKRQMKIAYKLVTDRKKVFTDTLKQKSERITREFSWTKMVEDVTNSL